MNIKVLGSGCVNCRTLFKRTERAVKELNLNITVEKVEDIMKIMEYKVISTPALAINDEVVVSGRVPKVEEIKQLLTT